MKQFFSGHGRDMFALLEQLVRVQSNSLNKPGVDEVGRLVEQALADLPLICRRYQQDDLGDHLIFSTTAAGYGVTDNGKGEVKGKNILIAGHMDTVFPKDTDFNWYREDADNCYGPGVIDMKGGLVVTIFALRALDTLGLLTKLPLVVIFTADEEIGSPTSTPLLLQQAEYACCSLITECGGIHGEVVTGRRGKRGYHLAVHGRAGHAAFAGPDKASAIVEIARKIPAMEALNNVENGLVVNVGTVHGGIGPNTVAEHAAAEIDTRYCSEEDGLALQKKIEAIAAASHVGGVTASLQVTNDRPLMEATKGNKELFLLFAEQAGKSGIPLAEEFRSGVSDANTLAGAGVPVLDGLGPIGEHDHSNREYMRKSSLIERCRLLAATLPKIGSRFCGQAISSDEKEYQDE